MSRLNLDSDPDVIRYREERARRRARASSEPAQAAKKVFEQHVTARVQRIKELPGLPPARNTGVTERQRVLYQIDMEGLRMRENSWRDRDAWSGRRG